MRITTGYFLMDLINFALRLAFSSPVVTALVEPWLTAPPGNVNPSPCYSMLPCLCGTCGATLGAMEGGYIRFGGCSHCASRPNVPFDAMLGMAFALLGKSISQTDILLYLQAHPIDASYPRVVEKRQPKTFVQAAVAPTHRLINIDGLLDAVLNNQTAP